MALWKNNRNKKRSLCCNPCGVVIGLLAIGLVAGIFLWRFLPTAQQNALKTHLPTAVGGGNVGTPTITYQYNKCGNDTRNCCNGINTICDLRVNDVLFASLHNGQSDVQDGFLLASNHEYKLEDALQAGYRGINVDVASCNGQLKLIHGVCAVGQRDPLEVFTHVRDFLVANPNEIILMPLEIVVTDQHVVLYDLYNLMAGISGFLDLLYIHNDTAYWPTLRFLRDSNKRLIIFEYNADETCPGAQCPPVFHPWFRYTGESAFDFPDISMIQNSTNSCPITRGINGYMDFYGMNLFVSNPLPSKTSSQIINQKDFLLQRISDCSSYLRRKPSLIFIDWWNEGNLVEVVQTYNENFGALANATNGTYRLLRGLH
jgi:hypothetical protein